MKILFGRFWPATVAAVAMLAIATHADTVGSKKIAGGVPRYDISKEVTLEATVTNVVNSKGGILAGGHLVMTSSGGMVDGVLGPFALRGAHALPVAIGDHVKVVGVPTTIRNAKVFLVRDVQQGNHTYIVRNSHGIPLLAGAPAQPPNVSIITGGHE